MPSSYGQCDGYEDIALSPKLANYVITADLDRRTHTASCQQQVTWTNNAPHEVAEIRLYMYMNAFKDRKSTYLRGINDVFGADLADRTADEWGHITISSINTTDGADLSSAMQYIQPNDGNVNDQTVLKVNLPQPVVAGQSITLAMDFEVKLPKTVVRAGYGQHDFHLFVHWFPQMGVYEQDKQGQWGWNCHQFMQKTEFYADFGNYDVTITTDSDFVVGATGCQISEDDNNGRTTRRYKAYDVIDFGWTAYPLYETYSDRWQHVDIELLIPGEHCGMASRYIEIVKKSLDYLDQHVGRYYYPKITIVDPPVHSLRSGFMEYPMLITVASVYGTPKAFRGSESLAIHELTHMYFMGMLASNEKEEAWLDEGFVTYYEDEILDHYYGSEGSFYDFGIVRTGNAQKSRQEYTTIRYPEHEVIAKPGWENKGYYKELVYGKTATVLRTFKNIVGPTTFEQIIKYYFEKHKFTHPREADWLAAVDTVLASGIDALPAEFDVQQYWYDALHTTHTVDYQLVNIDNSNKTSQISVRNNGKYAIPTTVLLTYADGSTSEHYWAGATETIIEGQDNKTVVSAQIDPSQKVMLDLNYINNSMTLQGSPKVLKPSTDATLISELIYHLISLLL